MVFTELIDFRFFNISGCGMALICCDVEWFALEMNQDHSVISEVHRSNSFQTLLLTMRTTPFPPWDSCPQ